MQKDICDRLSKICGLEVLKYDQAFLYKTAQNRSTELNCTSTIEYFRYLNEHPEEKNCFTKSLQIGHSEFFRNALTYSVLEKIILPSLILKKSETKRKEIRVWSAACSSGHEPYSIAILFEEIRMRKRPDIQYRIFATDSVQQRINTAKEGIFEPTALSQVSLSRLKEWFVKTGNNYTVSSRLNNNIDFSEFDLTNESHSCPPGSIFGEFDLIFCANLLFYYNSEFRKIILDKISKNIASKGYLVTGEAERDILKKHNYKEVFTHSAIFIKK